MEGGRGGAVAAVCGVAAEGVREGVREEGKEAGEGGEDLLGR